MNPTEVGDKSKNESKTKPAAESNSKKNCEDVFEYEFGGPIGAAATTIFLPMVTLCLLHFAEVGSVEVSSIIKGVIIPISSSREVLLKCAFAMLGWFCFQVALERLLPAENVEGTLLQKTTNTSTNMPARLTYRINGHLAFWVTLAIYLGGYPVWEPNDSAVSFRDVPLRVLQDHADICAYATIVICFLLSLYLYLKSFADGALLAKGGDSGVGVYDFFMGRELNPRPSGTLAFFRDFDWKEFCELRPGLIGWLILNLAYAEQQRAANGGTISGSMVLVCAFQGIYVWDALYQERAILTTMDITTDGFGFMLCFGDLAWVPYTYSLQARYLVRHDPSLGPSSLVGILLVHALGYYIFRSANSQKDAFRRNPSDPSVNHLKYLKTKRGTKLLTSGWWGRARKINYTGDWIMGLSWCLTCGFNSIVPYFYAIYFAILLIHRSIRDDHMCREKYGEDWDEYKRLVPYRFIPGIV